MTNDLAQAKPLDDKTLLSLIGAGDTKSLTPDQKLAYYKARCDAAGLDARATPFQFINLQGREVLYALKGATEQLAAKHKISLQVVSQVTESGVRTVTVRASMPDGRCTDEIGCVTVGNAQGDQLANANMKAVTKAKRRAVLSLCGLGMLDETELETIPGAVEKPMPRRKSDPKPVKKEEDVDRINQILDASVAPAPAAEEIPTVVVETPKAAPSEPQQMSAKGKILGVQVKSGPTWKRFTVKLQDPILDDKPLYFGTFDTKIGEYAETMKGKPVELFYHEKKYTKNGKEETGYDIDSILPLAEDALEPLF